MHTYKITLIEQIKVIYQIVSSSDDEALEKAKSGNATFVDGMMLGNPSDYFELEILE